MLSDSIPVFLNGRLVRVPAAATLTQLVAQEEPDLVPLLATGRASATDARGLPVAPDQPLSAGAILRVFRSARGPSESADA